jgi:predicted nucleic acid-binding protein
MRTVAFDTSALMALVIDGQHRPTMLEAFATAEVRTASAMALVEAVAALDRLSDEPTARADLEDAVRLVWDHLHVVPLDTACCERAAELARLHPLRLSDAFHLAAAERLPTPVLFATVDPVQITSALDLGFEVIST